MKKRHRVTNEEWAHIEPLLPKQGKMGRPRKDARELGRVGPIRYTSEQHGIWITALYTTENTIFNFNLTAGANTFPSSLTFGFIGDGDCTSFRAPHSSFDYPEDLFIRSETNDSSCEPLNNPDSEAVPDSGVELINSVVKNPTKSENTFEIDERLVGKYMKTNPEVYLEIGENGTAEFSLKTDDGYVKYGPKNIRIVTYHSDIYSIITLLLIRGGEPFPKDYRLAVTFRGKRNGESLDSSLTPTLSRQ